MQTADFYSSATGTLRVNGGRDENAPAGVSLSIDDLSYIKQGSRANEESGSGFTPTEAQLAAMNSGITSSDVAQITTNKNNISTLQTSLAVGSSDNAKVLTAIYEGGEGSYAWVTPSGGGGTSDYTDLTNKPQINGITLNGNKSLANLGIAAAEDIPTLVSGLNTTGTVKNGSSVTSATGYTPSPIISGIPYYKDTTYESKSAASGGTAVSLCTTGEKYIWNNKQSALTTAQLSAVNSGIDSTKVAQIATNEANILLTYQTLIAIPNISTSTIGSLTHSENVGTITINGTSGSTAGFIGFPIDLAAGTYKLSGCPSGGSNDSYSCSIRNILAGTTMATDYGDGATFTLDTAQTVWYNIRIATNYTANNVVFKPLINQ